MRPLEPEYSPLNHNSAIYPVCALEGLENELIRDISTGYLRLIAVSSGHHPLVVDEGTTTEVVASVQGHLVGDGILLAGVAPDDLVIVISGESNLSGDRRE